ncbi:MAG: hydroxyectoine utilization dehydratase EutB [Rhizobiaceae bacterium]|nr:hydroxyectoine utilization dehydratase EutB [Rhizobiaceae bacterium]MCV0408710.1 hydroxyectoine utilization dehydratase EutB [Rhizobiaceae bacterium]
MSVTIDDIRAAETRIRPLIERTAMVVSPSLSDLTDATVMLKLEHRQITGSFKLRGATNAVAQLSPAQKARGVAAASTGNHGRALAHAARKEGARAIICLSRLVPQNKVEEIGRLGAEARIIGESQDEAQVEVDRLVAEEGFASIPPFDHEDVIAGQGTLGLEIMEQVPEAGTVLVPLSGGGLAAGVAAAVKALRPACRVIGISMDRGAAMKASLDAGRPVEVEEVATLADSLGGGVGLQNRLTFAMCRELLDEVVLLTEAEIAAGMRHAYMIEREIVEGAGAVGIAALLAGKARATGETVVLTTGRNVDMEQHRRVICGEIA